MWAVGICVAMGMTGAIGNALLAAVIDLQALTTGYDPLPMTGWQRPSGNDWLYRCLSEVLYARLRQVLQCAGAEGTVP